MGAKSETLRAVCMALTVGDTAAAADIAQRDYPFVSVTQLPRWEASGVLSRPQRTSPHITKTCRAYSKRDLSTLFARDGFFDCYSGHRVVYPPVFGLLTRLLPEAFPAHPNWKLSESHIAYWELFATLDHVMPVAAGGADTATNWVTTAMTRNMWKADATLADIGWSLVPPSDGAEWDGLSGWFLDYVNRHPAWRTGTLVHGWYRAARATFVEVRQG